MTGTQQTLELALPIASPAFGLAIGSFSRVWAMPNGDTFSVSPIGEFVQRRLRESTVSIDPFARNKRWVALFCAEFVKDHEFIP